MALLLVVLGHEVWAQSSPDTITNIATVTPPSGVVDPDPDNNSDDAEVFVQRPALSIVKSSTAVGATVGSTIEYSFLVTNTGNVDLTAVVVKDAKLGADIAVGDLAAGASATVTGSYTLTAADFAAGEVVNTATAEGTPPGGGTPVPSDPSTVTTPLTAAPALSIVKSSTAVGATVGSTIEYSFLVTNTGNVDLTAVVVKDAKLGADIAVGDLAAGASATVTGSYTLTAADFAAGEVVNTATAEGTPPGGGTPVPSDPSTVTTPLTANVIDAVDDGFGPVNGGMGGSAGNAYDNDTLNGQPVDVAAIVGTVLTPATPVNGGPVPTLDAATGVVTVPAGTPAGDYTIVYQICEALNPANCDTAIITVTVEAPSIDAVDDGFGPINGGMGGSAGNAYDNDTLNGQPVDVAAIVGTVLTPATPVNGGSVPTLDAATGVVTVPAGTPAGDYTIVYQICEALNPVNCDTATITVTVEAPLIEATDDPLGTFEGTGGDQVAGNAFDNDRINGVVIVPSQVTGEILTPAASISGGAVPVLDPATGVVTIPAGTPSGDYTITYRICEVLNPTNCDTASVTVTVEVNANLLRITKAAGVRTVVIGDLVRYTLTVENVGTTQVQNANVIDTPPAGFTYVEGSLNAADDDGAVTVSGQSPLRFDGIDLAAGRTATLSYLMRVGAGVRPGTHQNQAQAYSSTGEPISNIATAAVELTSDPLFEDSLIFGTVFDDRDGDGWQDSATLSGVAVQGGFAPGAYVANSTMVDRGTGHEPEPDASSPLLHGIAIGGISARQSVADPAERHQVVVRQRLSELAFTDDFVLTSEQGVTVRMDAAGNTTVEKSGEAAKGLNAAAPSVERRVAVTEGGYVVDYVIRNEGIDERGIPGVRIASVEGLLIETDQYGRYHIVDVHGGEWRRGRNFILKVDPSTLPAGAEFTTDNPLLRRITPGVPVRFDWGVKLPVQPIPVGREEVELELGEVLFAPGSAELRAEYQPVLGQIAERITGYRGGEILISAAGDTEGLAFQRAEAVRDALLQSLDAEVAKALRVSLRTQIDDPHAFVAGVTEGGALLGTVLFDTDKSSIRPEFEPLLDKIAERLQRAGGGRVGIVGHTDVRGSHAYNTALGLRRAKAVYDALERRLSPELRTKVRVDINDDPAAPVGGARQ
ncbi:DUF7507 domain-containing protein [Corticibacter populi]|nr:OmpA family protein [Corticibacter populi]